MVTRNLHPSRLLDGQSPARRGVVIYVVAGLVFVLADVTAKILVQHASIADVMFGRNVAYVAGVTLFAWRGGLGRLIRPRRPVLQVARGAAMFASNVTFFIALSLLPLGIVATLASTTPLWVLVLAGPLLAERLNRWAVAGGILGFAGVMTLTGIDVAVFDLRMLVPLTTALTFAFFAMITRELRDEEVDTTVFWSGAVGLAASAVLMVVLPGSGTSDLGTWLGIGLLGLLALLAHRLLVAAFRWGRASDLAPLGYLGVFWSFVIGAAFFAEPILPHALIGAVAIAAGGIIALRATPGAELVKRSAGRRRIRRPGRPWHSTPASPDLPVGESERHPSPPPTPP